MTEDLSTAVMLMGVGMITVFIVLLLVVLVGNSLILFVNKFVPEEIKTTKQSSPVFQAEKLAAITTAVEIFTEGKGRITKIDKIN